jgi:muramoyltetrapeptide carboxypeptidase LdcA involved in peptidoglycan recycling
MVKQVSSAIIKNEGKEEILDRCLEELRNKMRMKQASRILLGAPTKETKKRPPLYGHHIEYLHLSDFSRTKLEKIEEIFRTKLKK